ncbi:MAG: PorV/PorQ family protein [Bacteroidetes bacterium]|nr:PorV/PorQ family protein [Bacteroidota bacterium]
MRKILIAALVLFCSGVSFAQNDGAANTGMSFLKLGIGARSISMGEAFVSLADDGTAFIYNPARINATNNGNVTVMFNKSMLDMTTNFVGAKFRMNKFGIGIGLLKTTVSDIEVRNNPGEAIETFNSDNFSGGVSLCYDFRPNFSIGATIKMLYEKIYIDEASGYAFDFGANYKINDVSFAMVLSNLGSMNALYTTETKLPAALRFGASYVIRKSNFTFTGALDGFKVLDGGTLHTHMGAEAGYKDFIFLRAGYQTGYENKSFSAGLGLKYKTLYLDYAFQPYTIGFSSGNSLSLGFNF